LFYPLSSVRRLLCAMRFSATLSRQAVQNA
jgi:hypothetical protein